MQLYPLLFISIIMFFHISIAMEKEPDSIEACEIKNQPFSLLTLALNRALWKCITDPSYKTIFKEKVSPEIIEKAEFAFFHHIAPFFENRIASDYAQPGIMISDKRSFHISHDGNRICIRFPKNHQDAECEVIDVKNNFSCCCKQKIIREETDFEGNSHTFIDDRFKKLFQSTRAVPQLSALCTSASAKRIFINPSHGMLLIAGLHRIDLFNVETKSVSANLDPATLQGVSRNFNYILFRDLDQNQSCVATVPGFVSQFTIPPGKDRDATMNPDAEWVASHDQNTIYLWSIPSGNLHKKINFDPSTTILQLVANTAGLITLKLKRPQQIKNIHSIASYLPTRINESVISNAIGLLNIRTGQYEAIYDPELTDCRLIHFNNDHSLAFYATIKNIRKLWSFKLKRSIQHYDPAQLLEKYKETHGDIAGKYIILESHQAFNGKSLDELMEIAHTFIAKGPAKINSLS